MLNYLAAFLGTGVVFAVVDAIWLTTLSTKVYRPTLDPVLAEKVAFGPAIAFYFIYIAGIVLLAVAPNKDAGLLRVAITGAILGFVAYATYDLTNQATLKVWATRITLIDLTWGTFVTAVGASAGYLAWRWAERNLG